MLAVLAVASFLAGVAAAGAMGHGPLAYISYKVQGGHGGGGGGNSSVYTVPVYVDLGELAPGQAGSFNGTAEVTVSSDGNYSIHLDHVGELKAVFAKFTVHVYINGVEVDLDAYGKHEACLNLPAGTYNATITVDYVVKDNPAHHTADNLPFLVIEAHKGHCHTGPHH